MKQCFVCRESWKSGTGINFLSALIVVLLITLKKASYLRDSTADPYLWPIKRRKEGRHKTNSNR